MRSTDGFNGQEQSGRVMSYPLHRAVRRDILHFPARVLATRAARVVAGSAYQASGPQLRPPNRRVATGRSRGIHAHAVRGVPSQSPVNAVYKRLQRSRVVWKSHVVTAAPAEAYELKRCHYSTYEAGGHGFRFPPPPIRNSFIGKELRNRQNRSTR